MHLAAENARQVHQESADDFARLFGRRYAAVDAYRLDDAETVLVMAGSFTTKGRAAVNRWRQAGKRVGLLRLRMVRPWPADDIARLLRGRRAVAVIDQNLSPGLGGILFQEVAATLSRFDDRPAVLRSFVGGLGGKDMSPGEFDQVLQQLESPDRVPQADGPVLLMTDLEWQQVRQRLAFAGKSPEQEVVG
jgi:pyruvate ferredoxin oxidoreductase alpha subunit